MAMSQAYVCWYAALAMSRISDQTHPNKKLHFNHSFLASTCAGGEFVTHKYNNFDIPGNFYRFEDGSALIMSHGASGNEPVTFWIISLDRDGKPKAKQLDPEELKGA